MKSLLGQRSHFWFFSPARLWNLWNYGKALANRASDATQKVNLNEFNITWLNLSLLRLQLALSTPSSSWCSLAEKPCWKIKRAEHIQKGFQHVSTLGSKSSILFTTGHYIMVYHGIIYQYILLYIYMFFSFSRWVGTRAVSCKAKPHLADSQAVGVRKYYIYIYIP